MTTPTGQISLKDVRDELKSSGQISLGDSNVRKLAGKSIGQISLGDLQGKSSAYTYNITAVKRTDLSGPNGVIILYGYKNQGGTLLGNSSNPTSPRGTIYNLSVEAISAWAGNPAIGGALSLDGVSGLHPVSGDNKNFAKLTLAFSSINGRAEMSTHYFDCTANFNGVDYQLRFKHFVFRLNNSSAILDVADAGISTAQKNNGRNLFIAMHNKLRNGGSASITFTSDYFASADPV